MPQQESELIPYQAVKSVGNGKALVFAPHPDDEVFGCGGAIIRHVQNGNRVKVIIVTDGGFPVSETQNNAEYASNRKKESIAAALILGYGEPDFWEYPDRKLTFNKSLINHIIKIINHEQPDYIYLPAETEIHPDHLALNKAVTEACRQQQQVMLCYYEIGQPLKPNLLLNITDLQPQLEQAMDCFKSQLEVQDYKYHINALHAYRSYTLGEEVKYAEAYRVVDATKKKQVAVNWQQALKYPQNQVSSLNEKSSYPLISVIVRTMNRPELPEALESISNQTYPNIEVIVVDAKGENVLDLGQQCGKYLLRTISKSHPLNRPEAANAGLEAINGDFFCFLDEDDLIFPDHITCLFTQIIDTPYPAAYDIIERVNEKNEREMLYSSDFAFTSLLSGNFIPINAIIFRSAILNKGISFDNELVIYEDWDFLIQVAAIGDFLYVDQPGGVYRNLETSGVQSDLSKIKYYQKQVYRKWLPAISDNQLALFMDSIYHFDDGQEQSYFAQLFIQTNSDFFSEKTSIIQKVNGTETRLSFGLSNVPKVLKLRFDPLNDCVRIRINSIYLLNQGKILNIPFSFFSNAVSVETNVYIFKTTDPQFIIDFALENSVELDEVIIELEYLQKGVEVIPELLKQKNAEMELSKDKTLILSASLQETEYQKDCLEKELADNIIINQKQSEKMGLQNELISSLKTSNDEILNQSNIREKQIERLNLELLNIKQSFSYKYSRLLRIPLILFRPFKLIGIIKGKLKLDRDIKLLMHSGYFDPDYYIKNNPDVTRTEKLAIKHYLLYGGFEGRKPSVKFDSLFYLEQFPDVKAIGMNPLVHYLKFGKNEGRNAVPVGISKTTSTQGNITKPKFGIIKTGQLIIERISGFSDLQLIRNSNYFNPDIYLRINPDVKAAVIDPAEHYLYHGWKEGRSAGNKFDSHFYLDCYPDIKDTGVCPLLHYLKYGIGEGRLPKPFVINEEECMKEADISSILNDLATPKGLKIAVICHLFYIELAEELFSYIRNIPVAYDLYLSTPEQHTDRLKEIVISELPGTNFTITIAPNNGRDIAPFIMALKTELNSYDLICKIHSKKSNHDKNLLQWRKYLLDNLLGNQSIISQIIYTFEKDPTLGMIYPLPYPYLSFLGLAKGWGPSSSKEKNRILAKTYFPELEIDKLSEDFSFPVGSMFWVRPQALDFFRTKQIDIDDFAEELNQIDATLAHAIERLFDVMVKKAGYVSKTSFFPSKSISLKDAGFSIPEQFSKRILFIAHDLFRAGAEIVLLNILNWFAQHTAIKSYVVAITRGNDGGKLLTEYQKVAEVFLWEDLLQNNSEVEAAKLLLENIGHVDLIYGNTVIAARLYPYLSVFNAPIVTHLHELEESIQRYTSIKEREALRTQTSHFVACSGPVKENLIMNHAINDSKIDLIHAFIKTDIQFPLDTSKNRAGLNLSVNRTIIWGCGTIYWRKGVDLFIETAKTLKNRGVQNFIFYWIGGNYWNLEEKEWGNWEKYVKMIEENGLSDLIIFLGERDNPKDYFMGGDIFYLPSREDPFPLVCLEAAECELPVICFDKAGGMPDFVENDAGIIVPFLDTDAAAGAIHFLITHDDKRKELGRNARRKLLQKHSDNITVPEILNVCRDVMKSAPVVSVIVPVYNHERFLHQRIESILNQTFRDFEIIILDDCSQDKSFEIAQSYLWHPAVSVIRNEINSGSPFRQWQKGIDMAKGSFIWIAEGDDYCDPIFLHKLLPFFNEASVALAYCNSWIIDGTGGFTGNYDSYLNSLDPVHWESAYQVTAQQEINFGLGVKNSIPNASAVIFRKKSILENFFNETINYQFSGDWYFYTRIIKGNEIAFCPERLNYHRKHNQTVTSSFNTKKSDSLLLEAALIHENILEDYDISKLFQEKWEFYIAEQIQAFYPLASTPDFDKYYPYSRIKEKITIKLNEVKLSKRLVFITTNDGSANGGSEKLWRQAAIECRNRGHNVMVVIKKWQPEPFFIESFKTIGISVVYKVSDHFGDVLKFNPDLVVISIGDQDEGTDYYGKCLDNKIPYLIVNQLTKEPRYWPIRTEISEQVKMGYLGAEIALFTGKNNHELMERRINCKIVKTDIFYNPFDVDRNSNIPFPATDNGIQIALPANLVCEHKGQHLAIELFNLKKWKNRSVHLNIYGSGYDEDRLKRQVKAYRLTNVTFHGHTNDILSVWKENHSILMPSFMEGLPLVLVGAMICGRVPIVTDIGAHREIIDDNISGFIAAQPTIEALDEAFERAFRKSESWEEIGNEARRKILSILPIDPIDDFISKILPHAKSNIDSD